MGTDGHSTKQGGAILPDALRWLWRGLSRADRGARAGGRAAAGIRCDGRVFSTIYVDKPWQQVGGDHMIDRDYGQVWSLTSDAKGNVYICAGNAVERVDADGNVTQFLQLKSGVQRLRFGADGRLYASLGTDEIVSFHKTTVEDEQADR